MEERYFVNINPVASIAAKIEKEKVFNVTDEKWAHPELRGGWFILDDTSQLTDPRVPMEEKASKAQAVAAAFAKFYSQDEVEHTCDIKSYKVPGCPEEPETEVEVRVYRPTDLKKKKARCLLYCLGGGLIMRETEMFPIENICTRHNCVAVVCMYRMSWQAPYPAAINDLHATYQWMVENADMLQINPDNVVLTGVSSGAHLATAVAFRLKRYGYSPKGIVAVAPQTDDRDKSTLASKIYTGAWDAAEQRQGLAQWMGNNFASSQIGPEALANHATVEDCIGYPPVFIHTTEFDPDRDNNREFYGKVLEAKTYAEYHCWAGAHHNSANWAGGMLGGEMNKYSKLTCAVIDNNIEDCFTYDLRRPWVVEEINNK